MSLQPAREPVAGNHLTLAPADRRRMPVSFHPVDAGPEFGKVRVHEDVSAADVSDPSHANYAPSRPALHSAPVAIDQVRKDEPVVEITSRQAARFCQQAMAPFQADALHPARRSIALPS